MLTSCSDVNTYFSNLEVFHMIAWNCLILLITSPANNTWITVCGLNNCNMSSLRYSVLWLYQQNKSKNCAYLLYGMKQHCFVKISKYSDFSQLHLFFPSKDFCKSCQRHNSKTHVVFVCLIFLFLIYMPNWQFPSDSDVLCLVS